MGTGKLVRQLCYQDQTLLRIKFNWNNIHKEGKRVDCYLVDLVVQRAHQQELTYIIFKLSSFTNFKLPSFLFKKKYIQEKRAQTNKVTQAKRGLDPSLKVETCIVELPNDENKLFDEEDDVGTSTIPDLSLQCLNLLLMSCSNYPHSILKGKSQEMGQISGYGNHGVVLSME